jgi:hypothetical protein
MNKVFLAAIVLLALILLWQFYKKPAAAAASSAGKEKADWTVYGTMGCGWTRKQLEELKGKNVSYTFVDCGSQECAGMSAFPVNIKPDGTQKVGFIEVN